MVKMIWWFVDFNDLVDDFDEYDCLDDQLVDFFFFFFFGLNFWLFRMRNLNLKNLA